MAGRNATATETDGVRALPGHLLSRNGTVLGAAIVPHIQVPLATVVRYVEQASTLRRPVASANQSTTTSIGQMITLATCSRAPLSKQQIHTTRTALRWLAQTQKGMLGARLVATMLAEISVDNARTAIRSVWRHPHRASSVNRLLRRASSVNRLLLKTTHPHTYTANVHMGTSMGYRPAKAVA